MEVFKTVLSYLRPVPWPTDAMVPPIIQNHRGYHLEGARENSLEAFGEAQKLGGQCCELDVALSLDKVPMVFHDENLRRLFSRQEKVGHLTALALEDLGIPSLKRVLQSYPNMMFNIELKSRLVKDLLPRKVVEIVQDLEVQKRVMFSSFNPANLFFLNQYAPNIPRALLVSDEVVPENPWYLRSMIISPLASFHMLNLRHIILRPEVIKVLRERQVPFAAWTVNDLSLVKQFLDLGALSVITDLKISPSRFPSEWPGTSSHPSLIQ